MPGMPGYVEVWINADHPVFFGRILGQAEACGLHPRPLPPTAPAASETRTPTPSSPSTRHRVAPARSTATGEVNITNLERARHPGGFVYVNSLCGIDPPGGSDDDTCNNAGNGGFTMNGNPSILVTEHVFVRGTCDTNPGPWSGADDGRCGGDHRRHLRPG